MLYIKSLYVLPSSAIRSRHSFFFPRRLSNARCLRNVLAERIQLKAAEELNNVQWIQKLLNETEGGGYQVGKFGMIGHDVAWGDMDSFNHVNNVMYLKWFETARVTKFLQLDKEYPDSGFAEFMSTRGVGPIIRAVELSWRYPITFPDKITIIHKVLPISNPDRFNFQGVIVSHGARKVAARIKETIVTVDYDQNGIKAPMPESIRASLEDLLIQQGGELLNGS